MTLADLAPVPTTATVLADIAPDPVVAPTGVIGIMLVVIAVAVIVAVVVSRRK